MKRLLWLLLLLVPLEAHAKILVVKPTHYTSTMLASAGGLGNSQAAYNRRTYDTLIQLLNQTGANYKVADPAVQAKTSMCQNGVITWNFGTAGAYTESFDAVVHIGHMSSSQWDAGYEPDSLTILAKLPPSVPQLFFISDLESGVGPGASIADDASAAHDTLGIVNAGGQAVQFPIVGSEQCVMSEHLQGSPDTWMSGSFVGGLKLNPTAPAGGTRALVSDGIASVAVSPKLNGVNCAWCDSARFLTTATTDTVILFERMMQIGGSPIVEGGKNIAPILVCNPGGNSVCSDSASSLTGRSVTCELEIPHLLMALAALDSITGGKVWESGNKLPIKMSLTIDGGFMRSKVRTPRGVDPGDTTAFYATIDSLASYHIPALLGVQTDSVKSYPNDLNHFNKWAELRYSPQDWAGVSDSTHGGNASWYYVSDVWGRYRKRVAYSGTPGAFGNQADTSTASLLASSIARCDSIFGRARSSRFILPPDDDWSPPGCTAGQADSVLYALGLIGVRGVRINAQGRFADPSYLSNPRGWMANERVAFPIVGGTVGSPIKLLGHTGYMINGAKTQIDIECDSIAPYVANNGCNCGSFPDVPIPNREINRAWARLMNWYKDGDLYPETQFSCGGFLNMDVLWASADVVYGTSKASLLRYSCQDFGSGNQTPATRPGWWAIKSINNQMKAINSLANRNIVEWAYPEDCNP